MILVVADASPIRYLIVTGFIDVLRHLFDRVVVPKVVIETELRHSKTPPQVNAWTHNLPSWVEVREPGQPTELGLHRGESDAIALAIELQAFAVLLDDADARVVAANKGVPSVGTVAILEAAADRGLLDLDEAFQRLSQTNFRVKPEVLREALDRQARRRKA